MSDLNGIQKNKFEKIFKMSDGYVLDFSNATFQNFIIDSIGIDIYENEELSKAKSLRRIWDTESDYDVGVLLIDLLNFVKELNLVTSENTFLYDSCLSIAINLKNNSSVKDLNLSSFEKDKTCELLLKEIKDGKEKENPGIVLDRLHTLATKYIRQIADKYTIDTTNKSLNSIFGSYVKELEKLGIVESDITKLIFKSNINILDKFNHIRNNKSLAHDNVILNKDESILIINNIIELLIFINKLEDRDKKESVSVEDIPF